MRGLGIILYGVEGIGKTSLALQFPKDLLFISIRESGFQDLEEIGDVPEGCELVEVESWGELLNELKESAPHFKTVVIDSLSGLQQIMFDQIIKSEFGGDASKFTAFYTGPRMNGPIWMAKVETQFEYLRAKGVNVIPIGHDKSANIGNPGGADYKAYVLDMDEAVRDVMLKWAQAVLFMTLDLEVMVTKSYKNKPTEAKVVGGLESSGDRIMYTTKHPAHSAKNRLKLPQFIPMGDSPEEAYKNFVEKLPPKIQEHLGC